MEQLLSFVTGQTHKAVINLTIAQQEKEGGIIVAAKEKEPKVTYIPCHTQQEKHRQGQIGA